MTVVPVDDGVDPVDVVVVVPVDDVVDPVDDVVGGVVGATYTIFNLRLATNISVTYGKLCECSQLFQ